MDLETFPSSEREAPFDTQAYDNERRFLASGGGRW